MVSIRGGEPLMHPQIGELVREPVARKKYVFLLHERAADPQSSMSSSRRGTRCGRCTSTGCASVTTPRCARRASSTSGRRVRECQRRGFRVTTNTTFFNSGQPQSVIEVLDYLNDDLQVTRS